MTLDIEKIKAAALAATQGEWICNGFEIVSKELGYTPIADTELDNYQMVENAAFIATANPSAECADLNIDKAREILK